MKLTSKKEITLEQPVDVYDIENTGSSNHNFCLGNGVVVHNCAKNPNYIYTSEEIINILSAIGYDPKLEDPLSKVQIGRMICLADADEDGPISADTKVILCNGTTKSIGQLAKDWEQTQKPTWVWALDTQGKLHPAEAYAPQITCYKDKYAVVELDDGTKIKCTLNHKFAVNYTATTEHKVDTETGVHYVAAKNLQPGDSIMSAYFKDMPLNGNKGNNNLYRHVQVEETYAWSGNYYPLHKLVAAEIYPNEYAEYEKKNTINKNSMAIHHKDHNRMNNLPSNLEIITSLEHTKEHHSFNKNGYNGSELQKQKLKEYHQSERYINTELQKARQRRIDYNKTEKNRETTAALNRREDVIYLQRMGKHAKKYIAIEKLYGVVTPELWAKCDIANCSRPPAIIVNSIEGIERVKQFIENSDKTFIAYNVEMSNEYDSKLIKVEAALNKTYRYCKMLLLSGLSICQADYTSQMSTVERSQRPLNWDAFIGYLELKGFIKSELEAEEYIKSKITNHKVVSVTFKRLKEPKPFYCLTVPKYHNFLLADKNGNGICSSNCHINTLLLTLIFKVAPELFERGMVYIADMPDFYATYKDQVATGNSVSEVRQKLNAMKAPKSVEINHIKGWGEINSSLMKALAVDKATRKLIRIKALTDHDRVTFIRIMNDDVAYRRQMLGLSENV